MSEKIAIASTDGKVVNQHFGKADVFYIVCRDEKTKKLRLLETRTVTPVCHGADHDDAALQANAVQLSDCKYILVSRIGQRANRELEKYGIQVFLLPGIIEESVDRLFRYIEVQKLLSNE